MMAAGSVSTLAQCENGLMLCSYQRGTKSFLRTDGTALNRNEGRTSYFEDALPFSEGLAAVRNNGRWGYIDTNGEYVVQPQYERATSFVGGCAAVYGGGMWQIIDTTGTVRLQLPRRQRGHARLRQHRGRRDVLQHHELRAGRLLRLYRHPRRRRLLVCAARRACASSSTAATRSTSPAARRCSAGAATSGSSSSPTAARQSWTSTAAS